MPSSPYGEMKLLKLVLFSSATLIILLISFAYYFSFRLSFFDVLELPLLRIELYIFFLEELFYLHLYKKYLYFQILKLFLLLILYILQGHREFHLHSIEGPKNSLVRRNGTLQVPPQLEHILSNIASNPTIEFNFSPYFIMVFVSAKGKDFNKASFFMGS